jgi:hypothetical protein
MLYAERQSGSKYTKTYKLYASSRMCLWHLNDR